MHRYLAVMIVGLLAPAQASAAELSSSAICRKLEGREPPDKDRPTAAQIKTLKGCDSEALYYDEKGPPDFVKARLCAFQEDGEGQGTSRTEDVFAGQAILMQVYANGLGGVKRDLDQATSYACAIEGAPAEVEFRVKHLQALKTKPKAKPFDYCDDITSGLAGGFCAARDAAIASKGRALTRANLEARVAPPARAALAALRKAADTFVDAHGDEVDESGTARAQMVIDEQEATRNAFTARLADLIEGRWPKSTPAQAKAADDILNSAYKTALVHLASKDNLTTVKSDDALTAQRAWIAYRDAFIAFARAAAPGTPPEAVAARLSLDRVKDLTNLAS